MNQSTQKVAVVTGGGTGIGKAVAHYYAQAGYEVVALGLARDEEYAEQIHFIEADVVNAAQLEAALHPWLRVDVLVNAAGIILHENKEYTETGFRQVIDVNLLGSMLAIEKCRDRLVACQGSVINIASMWSYFGSAKNPAYAASKGAVVQLTKSYAVALAELGVRVNAVAPGWIDTRLSSGALKDPARSESILQRIPMKRWGTPEDVANVVLFLSSAQASYVTGTVIAIDGGFGIA